MTLDEMISNLRKQMQTEDNVGAFCDQACFLASLERERQWKEDYRRKGLAQ